MAIPQERWHVPVRLDVERWTTRQVSRRVLVVVHTVTAGQRVLEAARLLEGDPRVQVFFTAAPDVFSHGVAAFLERLGGLVLPWDQAVQTKFDLALAAGHGALHELHSPVLTLPHGAGHNKIVPGGRRGRPVAERGAYGLDRSILVRDGAPRLRHRYERVADRISSEPGRFARRMRALLYRKLRLRAPAGRPATEPARLPRVVPYGEAAGSVCPR